MKLQDFIHPFITFYYFCNDVSTTHIHSKCFGSGLLFPESGIPLH